MEVNFGDFDENDALEEPQELTEEQIGLLFKLKDDVDSVLGIDDSTKRKHAAKALVRQLNGEE